MPHLPNLPLRDSAATRWAFAASLTVLSLAGPQGAAAAPPPSEDASNAAAGVPAIALAAPATVFLGEAFTFSVTFDNASGADTGYGPFIDLLFPVNGADGAGGTATPDGISFTGATYLGLPLTSVELTFPDAGGGTGCVDHPYARDTTGAFIQVCGTAGDSLVVLQLPFGSFTPTQPPATVVVGATLSNLADVGTPLTIRARGGFRFGNTPLDDWCCDPVILLPPSPNGSGWPSANVTPALLTISKTYVGPEDETATGPNFPRQYTITVDLPPGQTVTDLDVTDDLPNNIAFLSVDTISPAGSIVQTPTVGSAANPPNNRLVVNFPSVTGSATVTFSFFVPLLDANGTPVVPPLTGVDAASPNRAGAVGDWTPIDPRDAGGVDNAIAGGVCPACSILHTLSDRSIAVQKGVTIVSDTGVAGPSPGDTLQYSLAFQISDFFAFDGLLLTDTFSDGQLWDAGFAPTLSLTEHGAPTSGAMLPANFTVFHDSPGSGTTTVTFRVSDELVSRTLDADVLGGCVPAGGTGGPPPDCSSFNGGATTGTVTFRTVIQDQFTDTFPSGDPSVDQGDVLGNDVTVTGDVLAVDDLDPTGSSAGDVSAAGVTIPRGSPDKSIYAVNGAICWPCTSVEVDPGDTLTYRLQYGLPTSDFEDLSLTDYLPLPVLHATEVTTFDPTVDGTAPPAGTAKFGPADTFYNSRPGFSDFAPLIATDPVGNSVQFTYGNYDDPTVPPPSTAVDILFTVTVSNDPFTDRLLLTNQLRVHEGSTNSTDQDDDGIVQFTLREPFLAVKKGVIATNSSGGVFAPATTGPVSFTPPGSGGIRFTPPIDSTNMGAAPIDSNLGNVDADDLVSFAISIENLGSSPSGAFDIVVTDTLQPGFVIPVGGLNLTVTLGDGSAVAFVGAPAALFGAGIELVDPGLGIGICEAHSPSSGRNIILITYDLQIDPSAEAALFITNTAEVTNYAGEEGGEDHTGGGSNPAFQDDAEVSIASPTVAKVVLGTNQAHTVGLNVAIGELVQYQATITVPEGTSSAAGLVDTLDSGLAFVSLDSLTASPALSTDVVGGFGQVMTDAQAALAAPGSSASFGFGRLTNGDTDNNTNETLTLTYTVAVLNSTGNNRGVGRNNNAVWTWSQGNVGGSAPNVVIVEPTLQVAKSVLPTTADAGDTVTYTIVISHTGASNANAFELSFSDVVPAGLTYVPTTFLNTAGLAPTTISDAAAPTLTATWTALAGFPLGTTSTLTFQATLDGSVSPGQIIANTGNLSWTGLPGNFTAPQSPYNGVSTERTGDTANPGGAENDYRASGTANVTVASTPTKSIRLTSEALTTAVSGVERVAIGEIARYRLLLQLPEGTATNFQLQDVLPAGMVFLDDSTATAVLVSDGGVPPAGGISSSTLPAIDAGGNPLAVAGNETTIAGVIPVYLLPDTAVSSSPTDPTADSYGSGTDPYFWFGTLVNFDRDVNQEFVLVEFNAVVENVAGNQSNTLLNDQFRPRVNGVDGILSNTVAMRVAESDITNLGKAVTTIPDDAGDPLVYSLTYGNSASGDNAAAAFDIRLTDTLDSNLELVSVAVVAPGYAAVTDNSSTLTDIVDVTISRLNPGDSATITVTAQVIDTAPFGATIPNTANLTYTSLPGPNGTTPNATGSTTPGAPGTATGERDGSGAPVVGSLNNYFDSASVSLALDDPATSKSILATSVATTGIGQVNPGIVDLVIGETVTFGITITLPEGDGPVTLTDDLPTVPNGVLGVVSAQVVSIGASLSGPVPTITISDVNLVDGINDRVVFNFGTVHNEPDGVVDADDQIVVEVVARAENIVADQNGDTLTNTATLDFGTGSVSDAAQVDLVEPVLDIAKTADDDTPSFGQTVTYTITVSHLGPSTADAFDIVITDTVPAGMSYVLGSASLPLPQVNEAGDPTIIFTIPSLSLASGSTSFTYQATVAAFPTVTLGQTLTNAPSMTWTSIDGADAGERSGAGGVNDYTDSTSETVTVSGPNLQLTKDDGGVTSFAGGVIAYTLDYQNVGNGGATGVEIQDTVPANSTFNPGASTAGWSCVPDNNAGSLCTLSIGPLPAGGSGSAVFSVTVNTLLPAGVIVVTNTAAISDDGTNGPEPTPADNSDSDTTPVTAVPDLSVTKDDGRTIIGQGATLVYVISYANDGDQEATGVELTDTIPGATTFLPGSGTPGWSCLPDNNAGSVCTFDLGSVPAGGGGSVTFAIVVDDPVALGTTQIVNTVTIDDDGTNGPDANPLDNSDTDTDNLMLASGLTKTLVDTNQTHTGGTDAAIGEILTYQVLVIVPPGTLESVTLADVLERGLVFDTCQSLTASSVGLTTTTGTFADVCDNPTVATEPPGSTDPADPGRRATFDLGDVTNGDTTDATLTLTYDVVVLDSAQNVRGQNLRNAVTLAWSTGTLTAQAAAVTLVEPTLTLAKIAAPTVALPGTEITFTLTVAHTTSGDSDAFDLVLQDVIPAGLTYVPGSLVSVSGQLPTTIDDSLAPTLTIGWDTFFNSGVNAVIEFRATLGNLGAGSSVTNSSLLEWSSLPGDVSAPQSAFNALSTERYYDPGSAVDIYGVVATATVQIPSLPETGFAPGRNTPLSPPPEAVPLRALGGLALSIPTLRVETPIVGVPRAAGGWDLTWLADQAGYLEGTAFPTLPGNSALTGHVYLADGTPGPFLSLDQLTWGDEVRVMSDEAVFVYAVRQVFHVQPDNLNVLRHEDYAWLTLITCEGFDETRQAYARRVVVRAVLVSVEPR